MKDFFIFIFSGNSLGMNIIIGIILFLGILLISGFIFFIVYSIYSRIGFLRAKIESKTGKITNKYYHGESVHPAFGMTTGEQMTMTTTCDDAEYTIEYKLNDDGKKYRIDIDSEIYDSLDIGDKVRAYYKISKTTGEFKWTGEFEKI